MEIETEWYMWVSRVFQRYVFYLVLRERDLWLKQSCPPFVFGKNHGAVGAYCLLSLVQDGRQEIPSEERTHYTVVMVSQSSPLNGGTHYGARGLEKCE